jgi:23S rRNA pseudouridine1911/1915/1917 synthase
MSDKFRLHELVLPPEAAGVRLDVALAMALPQYSRSRLQRWIQTGAVLVAGRQVRPRLAVQGGEAVTVRAEYEADGRVQPQAMPLAIVHEDEGLIVVDKPAGMVVHPGAGNPARTLQNALLAHDPALAKVARAGLVHRLDKDTSGLLLVARTPEMHHQLTRMLQERLVTRLYLAVVRGQPTGGGTVDAPLGRHRTQRTRMDVRRDGRTAITHFRVEERFRAHALLRVQLETGRTHQIRVHLAHIGMPIVGDPLYGGRARQVAGADAALGRALAKFRRQALHAEQLSFVHPLTGAHRTFRAPVPADLRALLRVLRTDAAGADDADDTDDGDDD